MPRQPGRDQGEAMKRHVRLLTRLAQAAPGWVNRDTLMRELGYSPASARDAIARDVKILVDRGWAIEKRGEGTDMAHRLLNQDPRLNTLLTEQQIAQLARAVSQAGQNPAALGLPTQGTTASVTTPIESDLSVAFHVEEALHALQHQCLLHVEYKGQIRDLHVDDVRRTGTGRWRIIARDDGVQKVFRVDRIESLRVGAPGSASPPQPVTKHADPLTIPEGDPITAVVATDTVHEARVIRELGSPDARTQEGEEIELRIPVINRWLWRQRLYQLGTRVRLIGPDELRDEIRRELRGFVEAPA